MKSWNKPTVHDTVLNKMILTNLRGNKGGKLYGKRLMDFLNNVPSLIEKVTTHRLRKKQRVTARWIIAA